MRQPRMVDTRSHRPARRHKPGWQQGRPLKPTECWRESPPQPTIPRCERRKFRPAGLGSETPPCNPWSGIMTGSTETLYEIEAPISEQNDQSHRSSISDYCEQRAADKYALKIGLLIRAGAVAVLVAVGSLAHLFQL